MSVLREQWVAFTRDPAARVLCWELDADCSRLAQVFVAVEGTEEGLTTTLFLPIEAQVDDLEELWGVLAEALQEQWSQAAGDLVGVGAAAVAWSVPPREPGEAGVAWLNRVGAGLAGLPTAPWEHVAVAVVPPDPLPQRVWASLLRELHQNPPAEPVRWLLWCPRGEPLATSAEPRLWPGWRLRRPELDWPGLMEELLAAQPSGGLGDAVRQGLTGMLTAIRRSDPAQADAAYAQGMAEAQREGWTAVQTGLEMAYSQTLIQRGDPRAALQALERAFGAAQRATQGGDPQGIRLEAQALLALGAAQASAGDLSQAVASCAAAGLRANTLKDAALLMESWRSASVFSARAGDADLSWALGALALQALPGMSVESMHASSLGLLLEHLRGLSGGRSPQEREALDTVAGLLAAQPEGAA